MKATARVGERGQVVIPKQIRDELALGKDPLLEFEAKGTVLTLRPKKDVEKLRKALEKYESSQRDQFRAMVSRRPGISCRLYEAGENCYRYERADYLLSEAGEVPIAPRGQC